MHGSEHVKRARHAAPRLLVFRPARQPGTLLERPPENARSGREKAMPDLTNWAVCLILQSSYVPRMNFIPAQVD